MLALVCYLSWDRETTYNNVLYCYGRCHACSDAPFCHRVTVLDLPRKSLYTVYSTVLCTVLLSLCNVFQQYISNISDAFRNNSQISLYPVFNSSVRLHETQWDVLWVFFNALVFYMQSQFLKRSENASARCVLSSSQSTPWNSLWKKFSFNSSHLKLHCIKTVIVWL